MSTKYEKNIYLAMLAEQCNRFEEMVTFLEELLSSRDKDLNSDERNLLSIAYKNSVSSRRTALRTIIAYETKEKKKETSNFLPYIQEYRKKVIMIVMMNMNVIRTPLPYCGCCPSVPGTRLLLSLLYPVGIMSFSSLLPRDVAGTPYSYRGVKPLP